MANRRPRCDVHLARLRCPDHATARVVIRPDVVEVLTTEAGQPIEGLLPGWQDVAGACAVHAQEVRANPGAWRLTVHLDRPDAPYLEAVR